jgi:glycerophosphoryl diester phosphodiesterase
MRTRGLVLAALLAALIAVANAPSASAAIINIRILEPSPPPVRTVYAHRGGAGLAPENTLGAFRQTQAAFNRRGVWLEMDTQLTADNRLVVMHDDDVDRTTNCTGTVISHTLASLAGCDASEIFPGWGAFEPIPTMDQVLTEGRDNGWRLMVEIKDVPTEANFDATGQLVANVLIPLINATNFPHNRMMIQSFWPLVLDRVQQLAPDIPTVLLTPSTLPGAPAGVGIPAAANVAYSTLRGYTVAAPALDTTDLTADVVRLAHALGRKVVVWTPDTPALIGAALALGVDGVISNRPDLVYAALS